MNLAVNNLLQRDDEGEDAADDDDAYIHSGDLISLLDINSHDHSVIIDSDGVFDEDTLRITRRLGRSLATSSSAANADSSDRERRATYRLREQQRWLDTARDEIFSSRGLERDSQQSSAHGSNARSGNNDENANAGASNSKKSSASNNNSSLPVAFGEQLQFWTEKVRYSHKKFFHLLCHTCTHQGR